jgi:hypothetical protein
MAVALVALMAVAAANVQICSAIAREALKPVTTTVKARKTTVQHPAGG